MNLGFVSPAPLLHQRILRSLDEKRQTESGPLGSLGGTVFTQVLSSALAKGSIAAASSRTGLRIADYQAQALRTLSAVLQSARNADDKGAMGSLKKALSRLPAALDLENQPDSPAEAPGSKADLKPDSGPEDPSDLSLLEKIDQSITRAAQAYSLPATLIKSIIKAESNFQVAAVSPAGAQGLMQLMPGTAKDLGVKNPFDIEQNIDGGARYLRRMLDMFKGNVRLALAAYNAGPGAVIRHRGIPPYQETQQYVTKVLNYNV